MPLVWTQETLAAKSTEDIKTIRANAVAKQAQDVVALCDAELERRRPPKKPKQSAQGNRRGQYVSEFHFVCPNESEVKRDPSGTIRTGTWVVAEEHADAATKYGAVVALHVARAQPSYLQETIKS